MTSPFISNCLLLPIGRLLRKSWDTPTLTILLIGQPSFLFIYEPSGKLETTMFSITNASYPLLKLPTLRRWSSSISNLTQSLILTTPSWLVGSLLLGILTSLRNSGKERIGGFLRNSNRNWVLGFSQSFSMLLITLWSSYHLD